MANCIFHLPLKRVWNEKYMKHNTIVARPCVSLASKPATEVTSAKKYSSTFLSFFYYYMKCFFCNKMTCNKSNKKYSCCSTRTTITNYQRERNLKRKFASIRCDQFSTWQILSGDYFLAMILYTICWFVNSTIYLILFDIIYKSSP